MNDIQKVEYNGILVLTTQQIAEAYKTSTDTVTKNFNRNKDRYVSGKHYICLEGEELKDFKTNGQIDLSLKLNKLYLWTKKGAFLHAKSLNTDTAWEVYDRLVDSYFEPKQNIAVAELSPELQMFNKIFTSVAKQELEQKRQAEQIAKVEEKVDTMKEIFTDPIFDWRSEINARVREIAIKSGIEFKTLYNQMYGELEYTAHCSLKRLCSEKEKRMRNAGNTKGAIDKETSKIAIVEGKPQLKAIFENIVRKYAMKYCV